MFLQIQFFILFPKNTKFNIPPYLPDTEATRRDIWKLYNNIAEMDKQVGAVLKQLEDDGLLENTIVVFYGDHGGPLPREKRLIYDSGLNTPMIIRFPNKMKAGTEDNQLVSFVDFAPTLLSLIGEKPKLKSSCFTIPIAGFTVSKPLVKIELSFKLEFWVPQLFSLKKYL